MSTTNEKIFISYSREDSAFVLRLAKDLGAAGAGVWLDQIHIKGGERWPVAIEKALEESPRMLIILSPASIASNNVMDELSYALECGKKVIPVLWKPCQISFRLRNLQRVDFTNDYKEGLQTLLHTLGIEEAAIETKEEKEITPVPPVPKEVPLTNPFHYTTTVAQQSIPDKPIKEIVEPVPNKADQSIVLQNLAEQLYKSASTFYKAQELNKAKQELAKVFAYSPNHAASKKLAAEIEVSMEAYLKRTSIVAGVAGVAVAIFIFIKFNVPEGHPSYGYIKWITIGSGFAVYHICKFLFKVNA